MPNNNRTNRELLVRIDERQRQAVRDIKKIHDCLETKVDTKDFKPIKDRTNKLWDDRNRAIGWMIGAGVSGGGIAVLLQNFIKVVSAAIP